MVNEDDLTALVQRVDALERQSRLVRVVAVVAVAVAALSFIAGWPFHARAQESAGAVVGDSFVLMKDGVIRATLAVDDLEPHGVELILHGGDDSDPATLGPQLIFKADPIGTSIISTGAGQPRAVTVITSTTIPSIGLYKNSSDPAAELLVSTNGTGVASLRGGPNSGIFATFDGSGNPVWTSPSKPARP